MNSIYSWAVSPKLIFSSYAKHLKLVQVITIILDLHHIREKKKYHLPSSKSKQVLCERKTILARRKTNKTIDFVLCFFLFSYRGTNTFVLNFINWQKEITISNQKIINHWANLGEEKINLWKDFKTLQNFRIGNWLCILYF